MKLGTVAWRGFVPDPAQKSAGTLRCAEGACASQFLRRTDANTTHAPVFVLAVLLLFLLCTAKAQGQITFDAASSADTGSGTAGSLTWSHTVGAAGTNRILIVGVSIRNSASQTVSNVTYAGTNLTLVGVIDNATNARVEIWSLLAPVTGANNIIVTLSANARFVGGASSFTDVDQLAPLGAFFSNTGNSPTPTVDVTGVAAGEIVIDTIANATLSILTGLPCIGTGQTERWSNRTTSLFPSSNNTPGAGSTEPGPAGGGTVTMSWTLEGCASANNRQWAIAAVALKPAATIIATISATDAGAAETRASQSTNTGTFTVTLSAAPTSNVTINYTLTGTATNGTDYALLTGTLTINSGLTSGTITVTPTDDSAIEGSETVIVTLNSGTDYTVGTPSSATVTITDNDKEWDGGAGTANWVDAVNWDNNTAPNTGDNILFGANVPANVTVSLDAARTIGNLTFDTARTVTLGNAVFTLTVDGDTITVDQASPTIAAPVGLTAATTVSVAGGATLNSSAAISGGFSITKTGAGTLRLSGANTYTDSTTVSAGTLLVNGSTSTNSAVTVSGGATLGGTGTVAGALTINGGGMLAPGDSSASTLGTGALTLNNTTTLNYDLGTASDLTSVNGNLTLDGTLNVTAAAGFGVGTYLLFNYTGTLTNNTLVTGTMPAGFAYQISTSTAGQVNLIVSALISISGTVFEDLNYGGGSGRSLVSSSGVVRANAGVELYDGSGNFVSSTTTNAAGVYTFSGQSAANYSVRVVNSTVTSSRPGSIATLIPVQTFRTDASTGTAVDDANRVGGEEPSKVDAVANTTNATLASLTTGTTTAQSVSPITISGSNVTGVDFGFNFDTIVNVNNAGQGSLRQFVTNSNALGNGGLSQAGLTAGVETSIFMISDGAAHSGLRAGIVNQLTGGVASIALTSLLPQITAASTAVDGSTQTTNVGNTNSGVLGTGGTVGVDGLSLQTVNRPEVQIGDNGGLAVGLNVQANSVTVRGLAIYGFGNTANSDNHSNIRIGNNHTGALIEQNVLGATASSFSDPGAGARSVGDNIRSAGADSGTVRNNLIGFSAGKGIQLGGGSNGWLIEGNEVRNNGIGNSNLDGIDIENGSGGNTVRGNSFSGNEAAGIDMYQASGTNTVQNNTVSGNGIGPNANVETPGIRLYGAGNTIDRNIINANFGAGVMVTSGSTGNLITRNSIYGNGPTNNQIGIDLLSATDNQSIGTAPFVSVNDSGDADAGGNNRLNYPVVLRAIASGGNLALTGYARPGSAIELFIAAADPSGFGEGKTYLVTLTEGSAADTDATTGTYTNPVNGLNQGTDTTNKFSFTIPIPVGVSVGAILTATATLSSSTSEFSGNITVAAGVPNLTLTKSVAPNGTQPPGTDLVYLVVYLNSGNVPATTVVITDPIPNDTDFKVGSVTTNLGTTGLTVAVEYSNDGGTTWTYTPVSGAGGAPAGYDRFVTNIRWTFTGNLSQTSPNNTGDVGFTVRIR